MKKFAIITGGAIRVGKAISIRLAEEGYNIILLYKNSAEEAKNTAKIIEGQGRECILVKCDLSEIKNLDSLNKIFSDYKNINLLVNNSSIFEKFSFAETDEENFDKHFAINFKAPFFLTQKYYNYCKNNNQNGHVINILDSYIKTNSNAYFAYLLSKKSLANFTEMVAKEIGDFVRVNAVSIGLLLPSKFWDINKINEKAKTLPLKRKPEIEDVLEAILYLDKAKNITGANIFVDSGQHLM
ncbi:MAG: SDR family oxidoreductase [Rickettsiales bacterium]|nr:SDR family oxidoreductase [Rickettsiales bacterium]